MTKRWIAGGLGLGTALMYLLDPAFGRRRRAILRDKFARAADRAGDALGAMGRDLANRGRGLVAETRALVSPGEVSDRVLEERVRARLGRVVSHPGSITVEARQGVVTLSGAILEREVAPLLSAVASVRGVRDVENRLEVHEEPGHVGGLQGDRAAKDSRIELLQKNWSPAWRLLAGLAGGGMTLWGVRRRRVLGTGLATAGTVLMARAASNLELKRLLGIGASRRGIDFRKTLFVRAPVEEVFAFWSEFENFPRFFAHVREVRDDGRGKTHWKVEGPAGLPVEWDAVVTAYVPDQLIAWKTAPGEAVKCSGIVRFDPTADGGTLMNIRMTYKPPAGVLGHAVASLFGTDPETSMDRDLMRFKALLETARDASRDQAVDREPASPSSDDIGGGSLTATLGEIASEHARELGLPEPAELLEPSAETESGEGETLKREKEPRTQPRRDRNRRPEI